MSRRHDGSLPPTSTVWARHAPSAFAPASIDSISFKSRVKALHHWIRKGEADRAASAARALGRQARAALAASAPEGATEQTHE